MPRRLYLMSGNFDNPPASDSFHETADRIVRGILDNSQASDADISPSGELFRQIERFHRARSNEVSQAATGPTTAASRTMSSEPDPERRRRIQRESQEASPLFVLPPPNPPVSEPREANSPRDRSAARIAGMSARRGRPRITASDRYLATHRTTLGEGPRPFQLLEDNTRSLEEGTRRLSDTFHNGARQLETSISSLRSLLDDTIPSLSSPTLETQEYSGEAEHNRRAKRRKLDTDKTDSEFRGFKYGRYGQVEPGKLKMEIVSCDGGMYDDHPPGNYAAENVLRNDATVYCTKSNRCNLVLRHQGATIFSLKELVIKAPHSGYTAPVQEGMVFISMTSDDLLARTAQYQIQYSPPKNRRSGSANSNDLPAIMSIRHNGDGSMTTAQVNARRLYDIGLQDEDCDYRTAQIPSDFTADAPPFQVTTECSDDEGDEAMRARNRRAFHRNIGARFEDSDSSDSERNANPEHTGNPWHEDYLFGMGRSPRQRLRRRETASNITLSEAAEASQVATQEAVRAVGGELMVPHARFFIERDKSKCTVRFDPPVSGRFILLKMWSPHHSATGNIDIQSVVAKGFAGPRFFPAISLR